MLRFFDGTQETTLQCDATSFGLGAMLLQKRQPVAYASRALTEPETHYAQIEKELFSVLVGLEKFHAYTYGRHVSVENDHKPLETITRKFLHETPRRLQRMLLRLQQYDFNILYVPGKDVPVADALSRAVSSKPREQTKFEKQLETVCMTIDLPISEPVLEEIKCETSRDRTLNILMQTVNEGGLKAKLEYNRKSVSIFSSQTN